MNSDNIVREVARFSNGLHNLIEELTKELDAHLALIGRLEARIIELERKAGVDKGYSMTDLGNIVDEISKEGLLDDYIDERIGDHPDTIGQDRVRELARDEADEILRNASFSVTVD